MKWVIVYFATAVVGGTLIPFLMFMPRPFLVPVGLVILYCGYFGHAACDRVADAELGD